ncbi:succinate dehydrogenase, hydrophobic membrane anchor protein [Alcanivorax quisquiliarum]|uniref:Succinate dehydrogenase hydrophobic membrane anchor subunit n=1 Tax=Alcanivorax quisquiliarum TaxID=2933565 RepID=A0ABT0E2V4_9GAMM|nr:succinate dehydrogenase, hydrophobic membrane anchor protein [Alcanivorax quisquiliarum]MCK0536141.1 succinate dehydrogenase, hydrophobic membrane anchor protein [Alcanivorax quisquiliarum]
MVTSVTSLGRNGISDWLVQRVSAVLLGVYLIGLAGYLICTGSDLEYATWHALMTSLPMMIINTLVVFAIAAHAWIGLWIVTTDYLTSLQLKGAATGLRLLVQSVLALLLLVYVLWGLWMIWGGA